MAFTYKQILNKAKECKTSVEKDYKIGINTKNAYYFAKLILNPKLKKVEWKQMDFAPKENGNQWSRQVSKADYTQLCKDLIKFVEQKKRLPNFIKYKNKNIRVRDYTYIFAKIVVYYDTHKALPSQVELNSKAFTKPTETENTVYNDWVKTFKFKPTKIDDVCDYIKNHFTYEYYYDDHKSNSEVIKTKAGNCTDLSQMAVNMGKAMGYDWKAIHVSCNQSGTGHIYPMFRKKGANNGEWFVRDVACIADESRYCVWCEAGNGGSKIAENPYWFMQNISR